MDLLSLWPVVVVPLAAFLVFRLGRLSKTSEVTPPHLAPRPYPAAKASSLLNRPNTPLDGLLDEAKERFALDADPFL